MVKCKIEWEFHPTNKLDKYSRIVDHKVLENKMTRKIMNRQPLRKQSIIQSSSAFLRFYLTSTKQNLQFLSHSQRNRVGNHLIRLERIRKSGVSHPHFIRRFFHVSTLHRHRTRNINLGQGRAGRLHGLAQIRRIERIGVGREAVPRFSGGFCASREREHRVIIHVGDDGNLVSGELDGAEGDLLGTAQREELCPEPAGAVVGVGVHALVDNRGIVASGHEGG